MDKDIDESLICKICGGRLIGDPERGEAFCEACGYILDEHIIDPGPEWKAFDIEDKEKRVRVGSPITPTLHDYGIGSEIDYTQDSTESVGNKYDALRIWQKRLRTSSPAERSLAYALSTINNLCSSLKMPSVVAETASRIYRQLQKKGIVKSRSVSKVTAAIVYLSAKIHEVERSAKEVSEAAGIEVKALNKYYRMIASEASVDHLPLPTVERHIARLANIMKLSPKTERLALQIFKATKSISIHDGKSPNGLAAACIYIASVINSENLPQREVALAADITEVTVRHRYKEILDNYVIRQKLKPQRSVNNRDAN
ncbi:MAG: TFIIB-type zinc ribbon-containing protein [Nitrososphaerales archaeon]